MHIVYKKSLFWSFGIHFKGSSWQLNVLLSGSFEANPPASVTARTQLWGMAGWNTVRLLLGCGVYACVCVLNICVWARETSAIIGLLHPDNWEPAGIKITQRSSNFVIFLGLLLPTVVIFRVRPRWIVRGHWWPHPVTWLLIVVPETVPKHTKKKKK